MVRSLIAKRRFRRRCRPYPGSVLYALRYQFEKAVIDIFSRDNLFYTEEYR